MELLGLSGSQELELFSNSLEPLVVAVLLGVAIWGDPAIKFGYAEGAAW